MDEHWEVREAKKRDRGVPLRRLQNKYKARSTLDSVHEIPN